MKRDVFIELEKLYWNDPKREKRYRIKSFEIIEKEGVLYEKTNIQKNQFDKDGLITFPKKAFLFRRHPDNSPYPFGILNGEHQILLHRNFRRKCHSVNHYNVDLLEVLQRYLDKNDQNEIKVALEADFIAIADTFCEYFEFDYWFGAKYSAETIDDRNKMLGKTVHVHKESESYGNNYLLNRTEFNWTIDGDIKTLQVEELYDPDDIFRNIQHEDDIYYTRYFHAERNIHEKRFVHMDAAIKKYSKGGYENRLNDTIERVEKKKLFRIDKNIEDQDFFDILHFFYRGNKHIPEYFEGEILI